MFVGRLRVDISIPAARHECVTGQFSADRVPGEEPREFGAPNGIRIRLRSVSASAGQFPSELRRDSLTTPCSTGEVEASGNTELGAPKGPASWEEKNRAPLRSTGMNFSSKTSLTQKQAIPGGMNTTWSPNVVA